jgi:hypothetical protein
MKRAPPSLSETPLSKKIKIGDPPDPDVDDNDVEDDPAKKKKISGPYASMGQDSGGSGKNEEWTRVEKRKQKKAKKQEHKADVCVFSILVSDWDSL